MGGSWAAAQPNSLEIKQGSPVHAVAWSADGKLIATGSEDGMIRITEAATGAEKLNLNTGTAVTGVVFAHDGKLLGVKSGGPDGPLSVWDIDGKKKNRQLSFKGYTCKNLAFTHDGGTLVAGGPGEHMVWNHTKGGGYGSRAGNVPNESTSAIAADASVTAWANPQGQLQMYFPGARKHQSLKLPPTPQALAFTPDAKLLAVALTDKTIRLLDLQAAESRKFEGMREPAKMLHFSASGKVLAAASPGDAVVRLWDVGTGRLRRRLTTNPGAVRALALSPDGRTLALASGVNTYLWNVATRELGELGEAKRLSDADLKTAWEDLAHSDPVKADAGFRLMASAQHHAFDFLKAHIRAIAVPPVDWNRVAKLLGELEDPAYAVRQRASTELARMGEPIKPALEKHLATKLELEGERRLNKLLERLQDPGLDPDRIRCLEAIEILEALHTPAARTILEELARDSLIDQIRRAAKDALDRLSRADN
jgi:sugar lactone lactonase YvrE